MQFTKICYAFEMTIFDQRIPLNSLEKFMLAHESEHVAYNSQICIEFTGDLNSESIKKSVQEFIQEIPLLQTYIKIGLFRFDRRIKKNLEINLAEVLTFSDKILTQDEIDNFCQKKFDLSRPPLFRISFSKKENQKNLMIFNVHHTLCDAAGQFHLLEELFRKMNQLPIRKEAKTTHVFRYRHLHRYMGLKWVLKNIKEEFRSLKKQRMYQMATLIDHPERPERFVTSKTIYLTSDEQEKILRECKKREISITEYLTTNCFRALDKTLTKKGDTKTPIMVYLPKTLRPFLKIRYSLQNILSTVLIVGKREDVNKEEFYAKVKHIIGSHKMDKAAKFIYSTLLPTAILPPSKVQKIYRDLDQNKTSITSSLLISAGRVPRSFTFPTDWLDISVWARGTMLKSPGVGVIFTGVPGAETITIEYLKNLTTEETITQFEEDLMSSLLLN
jgi:NRPS condensation-like uncharacterized protein